MRPSEAAYFPSCSRPRLSDSARGQSRGSVPTASTGTTLNCGPRSTIPGQQGLDLLRPLSGAAQGIWMTEMGALPNRGSWPKAEWPLLGGEHEKSTSDPLTCG